VPTSSDIFNVQSIQQAGYPIVTWTVNDKPRMLELMALGVNGIISDRPDLLRQAAEEFDANNDGTPGDFLDAEGLIDISKFDAQGHRGGRNLRPENTLPAMEVALDFLMSTLETDRGITADGVPVLDHDPHVQAAKCRFAFDPTGTVYTEAIEVLNGFKVIFEVELQGANEPVPKTLAVDLMQLSDLLKISEPGQPGDMGIGPDFAFPFTTIESVVVFNRNRIGVLNDNNFPFSVGRHVGTGQPDDTEFILIQLERQLGTNGPGQ
jgi:glycerophosphoryl diester phosphodiesterase